MSMYMYVRVCYKILLNLVFQFQSLSEVSQQYEAGSQYADYVKRFGSPRATTYQPEPFVFEPYSSESR